MPSSKEEIINELYNTIITLADPSLSQFEIKDPDSFFLDNINLEYDNNAE